MKKSEKKTSNDSESLPDDTKPVAKSGGISVMGYIVIVIVIICVLLKHHWKGLFAITGALLLIFGIKKFDDYTNSKQKP
jgi:hypothetical protein